jgi:hypothetical protein
MLRPVRSAFVRNDECAAIRFTYARFLARASVSRLTTASRESDCRRSCSHTRITRTCWERKTRFTRLARVMFPAIFLCQYWRLSFGSLKQRAHPCQKQPSTKTARRPLGNQKSGIPATSWGCSLHPRSCARANAIRNTSSVERLPRERTRAITRLRAAWEIESITQSVHRAKPRER